LLVLFAALLPAIPALAATYDPPPLDQRLTPELVERVFPGAERLGPVEGSPPSIAVYRNDEIVGFLLSTIDVVAAPGYSGIPFDVIVGVGIDGLITGAEVIYHHEAFIERDPVRQVRLDQYLDGLAGTTRDSPRSDLADPDFVAGATVSARSMRLAVWDSARLILRARSGRPPITEPTLDIESFLPRSPDELVAAGALAHGMISNADMAAWIASEVGTDVALDSRIGRQPERSYLDVFVGLATPAIVGRNLLGAVRYDEIFANEAPPIAVLFVTRGDFNPRGVSYMNASTGYRLDRVRLVQGDITLNFIKDDFIRVAGPNTGIIDALDAGILLIPADAGFDPLQPWALEFLANGTTAGGDPFTRVMPVAAEPSQAYILMPEPEPPPPWAEAWTDARIDVIILGVALTVLTLLLLFQHRLTQHRRVYNWVRNGFLVFTLVWIGWIAGGQLSTLHFLNYAMAPFKDFGWAFYLAEPLILILAVYTLFALLLLGRGVFCGWLCPFGAMQELLAKIARFLRIPQWNPSFKVQSYAWLGKYVAAGGLVVVAIGWPEAEPLAAEVEPFKTAITSMFSRPLVYVGYAAILLGVGLFTERAYCRFLCPLGGILATLDRLHIFNLLKRRPECGASCHLCERSCPVKAIRPTGEIVMAECFQCLDCQVEYHDDRRCPPLAKERKTRERSAPEIGAALPAYARAESA
jgi:NosR/NirI family nitrous oxide reductase transcriptional regulator